MPPHGVVQTEQKIGMEPRTVDEPTFTAVPDGTLLSLVITSPDAEPRETVLGTVMTDGMERSGERLDDLLVHAWARAASGPTDRATVSRSSGAADRSSLRRRCC